MALNWAGEISPKSGRDWRCATQATSGILAILLLMTLPVAANRSAYWPATLGSPAAGGIARLCRAQTKVAGPLHRRLKFCGTLTIFSDAVTHLYVLWNGPRFTLRLFEQLHRFRRAIHGSVLGIDDQLLAAQTQTDIGVVDQCHAEVPFFHVRVGRRAISHALDEVFLVLWIRETTEHLIFNDWLADLWVGRRPANHRRAGQRTSCLRCHRSRFESRFGARGNISDWRMTPSVLSI